MTPKLSGGQQLHDPGQPVGRLARNGEDAAEMFQKKKMATTSSAGREKVSWRYFQER